MSTKNSNYVRQEHDWYVEPDWCVEALADAEQFHGAIYDPACGGGNILRVFNARGHHTYGTDIVCRPGGTKKRRDFLCDPSPFIDWRPDNIVTNPPYGNKGCARLGLSIRHHDDSEQFVLRALGEARRKVAILQKVTWLGSQWRKPFFESTGLSRVYVMSRRPSIPPGDADVPASGGSTDYAWFVWDKGHMGAPSLPFLHPEPKKGECDDETQDAA